MDGLNEQNAYKLMEAADKIGAHFTTINGWFRELENREIHFLIRDKIGDRIFLEEDIEIGKHIVQMREKKASLPAIYESLGDFFDLRPKKDEVKEETSLAVPDEMMLESLMKTKAFNDLIEQLVESKLTSILGESEAAATALVENTRVEREMETKRLLLQFEFAKLKAENELKLEAEEAWKKETNRTRKIAFFWSVEDIQKKEEFITKYIAGKIEDRLKKILDHEAKN